MGKYSEAQNKSTQRYIKKAYDQILIRVPKGTKEEYKKASIVAGYDSFNKFIVDAIEEKIKDRG